MRRKNFDLCERDTSLVGHYCSKIFVDFWDAIMCSLVEGVAISRVWGSVVYQLSKSQVVWQEFLEKNEFFQQVAKCNHA